MSRNCCEMDLYLATISRQFLLHIWTIVDGGYIFALPWNVRYISIQTVGNFPSRLSSKRLNNTCHYQAPAPLSPNRLVKFSVHASSPFVGSCHQLHRSLQLGCKGTPCIWCENAELDCIIVSLPHQLFPVCK